MTTSEQSSLVLAQQLGVRYLRPRSTSAKMQHFPNFQLGLLVLRIARHTRHSNAMNYLQPQQPRLAMLVRQTAIGRRRILDNGGSALAARCYATKRTTTKAATAPKKSTPRATVTKTTSSGGKAGVSSSIAAATPLRKPSTSGLGVPSKSPAASSVSSPPPLSSSIPTPSTTPAASTDDGSALAAAAREETLRTARLRRIDREKEAARLGEKERDYKERYDGAAKRYKLVVTALPILLVTSYFLFQQCECSSNCAPGLVFDDGD